MAQLMFMLKIVLTLHYIGYLQTTSQNEILKISDRSTVIIHFNPYVSILDKYKFSRYQVADLIPLVEKVASRFQKILIKLMDSRHNRIRYENMHGLMLSPLAAAKYNCLNTTMDKIEVFLEVSHFIEDCTCNKFYKTLHTILSLAEAANKLCNGTVTTILLKDSYLCNYSACSVPKTITQYISDTVKIRPNYLWGLSVDFDFYCDMGHRSVSPVIYMDYFMIHYVDLPAYINHNITDCLPNTNITKRSVKTIKSLITRQIAENAMLNMSQLVDTWNILLQYPSDLYAIFHAFDHWDILYSTSGWWYILNDTGNTTQFIFEEKLHAASKNREVLENFKWLQMGHNFTKNATGLVSDTLINFLGANFDAFYHIMFLEEFNVEYEEQNYIEKKIVYYLPILKYFKYPNQRSKNREGYLNVSIYSIINKEKILQYGHAFPLDICGRRFNEDRKLIPIMEKLRDQSITVLMFYFYEDRRLVRLGATRIIEQKLAMFEECKRIVENCRTDNVKMAFVSLGYYMLPKFYASIDAMQNYVRYVYSLDSWAAKQTNTLVFIGQVLDTKLKLHEDKGTNFFVGLYTFDPLSKALTLKSKEALELSKLHYQKRKLNYIEVEKNVGLSVNQVVIIVIALLLVFLLIMSLVIYVLGSYYNKNGLTKREINEFFNGEENSDDLGQKASYDKVKYEIDDKKFKIDLAIRLGIGEFGAVYRGTIERTDGELQVAVKMANPQKTHKTQLSGLLSEIKVLAHIGKHANIIELFGANTTSLKSGKAYIFLEYCHFGSLKSFLQEIRSMVSSPTQNGEWETNETVYQNPCSVNTKILDAALSDDFYRWSVEICSGMAFLAGKHVVHADLATRNVLLNLRREAKICDFGLSRRLYNYQSYVKTQQEPLPWKWMAPEALRDMEFNEKTDVWAFGVTLWEIYSLASTPYAGSSWDPNFYQMLERGLRLSEPEYCEREMYSKMQKCWNVHSVCRPNFSEILIMLQPLDNSTDG